MITYFLVENSILPSDNIFNNRTHYRVMYHNDTGRMYGKRKKRIHLTILMGLDDLCDIRTESSFRIFYKRKSLRKWQPYLIYVLLWNVPFISILPFFYLWQNGNETAFEYIFFSFNTEINIIVDGPIVIRHFPV